MKKINSLIEKYRFVFLIFLIFCIVIHFSLFTKNILTADVLLNSNYYDGYGWEISLGRFGLYLFGLLKGFMVFKEIEIFLAIILFSISGILLLDLFEIKHKFLQIIGLLVIGSSPVVSCTLLFHYCALPYSFAFFCGVLSIYLFIKAKTKLFQYIIPVLIICFSLSLYQAYFSIPITLIILFSIKNLFDANFSWKRLFYFLIIMLLSGILYFLLMKVSLFVFHINMSSYRGASSFGISTFLKMPQRVFTCYVEFYQYYFTDNIVNNSNLFLNFCNGFFIGMLFIGVIFKIIEKKLAYKNIFVLVLFLLLIPLGVNVISIILPDTSLQLLMSSGYLLLIVFFNYLVDNNKILTFLGCFIFVLMIRCYIIQDQSTYQQLDNTYHKTYEIASNIKADMIRSNNRKLMIVGNIPANNLAFSSLTYGFVSDYPLFWDEYSNLKNGWERFMKYYLGYDISFVDKEQYQKILKSSRYQELKYYPNSAIIDEVFIVKFDK